MTPETLNFWANVSAIFLMANLCVLVIATGVGLGFGWWYLRKGRKALTIPFLYAQVYVLRVQQVTQQASEAIVSVPIAIGAASVRVATTTKLLVSRNRVEGNKNGSGTTVQSD
jgi:hypothetical protein